MPLLIQTICVHFATRLIQINDGNTAIANHAIVQKVEVIVCDGIHIIITSKTAWVANRNSRKHYNQTMHRTSNYIAQKIYIL